MINDLLNEFLYLFDQYNDSFLDVHSVFISNDYLEISSNIKNYLACHNATIEDEFSSFLESAENEESLTFVDVEQFISELKIKLDKSEYSSAYRFQEGIYTSTDEEAVIGAEWSSKSSYSSDNTSIPEPQDNSNENEDTNKDAPIDSQENIQISVAENDTSGASLKITLDTVTDLLPFPPSIIYNLKLEGIRTTREIINIFKKDRQNTRFNQYDLRIIVDKLNENNIDFVKACTLCGSIFINDEICGNNTLCKNCHDRYTRVLNEKDFSLEILPPEYSSYRSNESGFHIYINIKNNTSKPAKIELKECSIFKNDRQNNSNYDLVGYSFTEDYIFPNIIKTFAKIWTTDKWANKDIGYYDYLTVMLKNTETCQIYYYKFNYSRNDSKWLFTDYYEI